MHVQDSQIDALKKLLSATKQASPKVQMMETYLHEAASELDALENQMAKIKEIMDRRPTSSDKVKICRGLNEQKHQIYILQMKLSEITTKAMEEAYC